MTFELEFLDGKRAVPRQLLSYRWSGDVTAGCDGLRLHFLWDGDLPEVYRVRGFAPDGACCFFGYADQQKLTVTPGQRRGFVYARSSACLLCLPAPPRGNIRWRRAPAALAPCRALCRCWAPRAFLSIRRIGCVFTAVRYR